MWCVCFNKCVVQTEIPNVLRSESPTRQMLNDADKQQMALLSFNFCGLYTRLRIHLKTRRVGCSVECFALIQQNPTGFVIEETTVFLRVIITTHIDWILAVCDCAGFPITPGTLSRRQRGRGLPNSCSSCVWITVETLPGGVVLSMVLDGRRAREQHALRTS